MKRKTSTKGALLLSLLSMITCVAMLIGSTFAWFTDAVSTGVNTIVAGNLDIELSYKNAAPGATFTKVTTATTNLFVNANGEAMRWEPGAASVCYFKLENLGTLALQYDLSVTAKDTVKYNGKGLSQALKTAVVPMTDESAVLTNDEAIAAATAAGATSVLTYSKHDTMLGKDAQTYADEYFAMVVYMPTTIGNDFNVPAGHAALSVDLSISLFATQWTEEIDSFDNQYDKGAYVSFDDLQTEAAKDLTGNVAINNMALTLTEDAPDFTIGGADLKASGVTEIVFNNGFINAAYNSNPTNNSDWPASYSMNGSQIYLMVPENAKIVFNNVTINGFYNFLAYNKTKNITLEFVDCTLNGCWASGYSHELMNITFKDCHFTLNGIENLANIKNTNPVWLQPIEGQTLSFDGCVIEGNRPIKYAGDQSGIQTNPDFATLNVTDCVFTLTPTEYDTNANRFDRLTAIRFDDDITTVKATGNTLVSGYAFYQTDNAPYSNEGYDDAGNNNQKPDDALWRDNY